MGRNRKEFRITDHPEYGLWSGMKARCHGKHAHPAYTERGIIVCDRWRNSFQNFITDMGPRPTQDHSLDRIDNNGNYEPSNCRWATNEEQNRNRRNALGATIQIGVRLDDDTARLVEQCATENKTTSTNILRMCARLALPIIREEMRACEDRIRQKIREAASITDLQKEFGF